MPVFENIILCPDALSGKESASMATFFDMALLLVYSILDRALVAVIILF